MLADLEELSASIREEVGGFIVIVLHTEYVTEEL